MPGGDRTGPAGMGPRTGRAAGYCSGYDVPGYTNPIGGRGFWGRGGGYWGYGRGRGGGRGRRNWYYATGMPGWQRAAYGYPAYGYGAYGQPYPYAPEPSAAEEADMLKQEAEALKNELQDIQERISALEKEQAEKKED